MCFSLETVLHSDSPETVEMIYKGPAPQGSNLLPLWYYATGLNDKASDPIHKGFMSSYHVSF